MTKQEKHELRSILHRAKKTYRSLMYSHGEEEIERALELVEDKKYTPTHKEYEEEYIRSMSSEQLCEYTQEQDEYRKLYRYMRWLEDRCLKN